MFWVVLSIYLKDIIFLMESNKKRAMPKYLTTRLKTFLDKHFLHSKELILHIHTQTHKSSDALTP